MSDVLHYLRCRHDKNILVTILKSPRPERCITCGSWLEYLFTVPVETDSHKALHAQGRVWNPHRKAPEPPTYQRYQDEEHPPLLTSDEITAREQERQRFLLEQEDRLEAAYQQKEQEHP